MAQVNQQKRRRKWLRFRILLCFCACFLASMVILGRAYHLHVLQGEKLRRMAERQQQQSLTLQPSRGAIFDRNGQEMAASIQMDSFFAEPQRFEVDTEKYGQLCKILELNPVLLKLKLRERRHFMWLKRWASDREIQAVKALGLRGIASVKESRRFYPHNGLAAHVIGFAGLDARGLEGVELRYEEFLRNEPVHFTVDRDAKGRIVMSDGIETHSLKDSTSVYLTIDKNLQYIAEKELVLAVESSGAKGGFILAANPRTMEILAIANYPSYNPNTFWEYNPSQWRNRAVTDLFEPGSVFKVFLAASALEAGAVTLSNSFYCEQGRFEFFGRTIHDIKPHGWLSVSEILKYSSNIGATKIGSQLGKARFYEYLRNFGFGSITDIDLPGESEGILRLPEKWSRVAEGTVSFGQGISVTGIQILTALCAVANDGVLMQPFVVSRVTDSNGKVVKENGPRPVRRVISRKTAAQVKEIMQSVVSNDGTGRNAMIPGYSVAGKTGTAQKVDPISKTYSDDKVVVVFAGFAPASDPKLAILVVLDEPEGRAFGGTVAAPAFRNVMKTALQEMGVRPEPDVQMASAPVQTARPQVPVPEVKENTSATEVPHGSKNLMPDLQGKDMRAVLRWAQQAKMRIHVKGSGWTVAQEPKPGESLEQGQVCQVIFQQGPNGR